MGGKAFSGKVRRVTKSEVFETVDWLSENWQGSALDARPLTDRLLGSAGKRSDSGDIDLNIDQTIYNLPTVEAELIALVGNDNVWARPGNNQIFTAIPIAGNPNNGFVQIDFMFGNFDWQRFSYFSPSSNESKYKGLFRTELLKAMVAFNSDWILEEDGEMVARVGPTFFHDRGIVWRYRYRPFKKNKPTERVKALKEVTKDEFMAIFPTAICARHDQTQNVDEVIKWILCQEMNESGCKSYELLWYNTTLVYSPEQLCAVSRIYLERLNSLKVDIPPEILYEHTVGVNTRRRYRIRRGPRGPRGPSGI